MTNYSASFYGDPTLLADHWQDVLRKGGEAAHLKSSFKKTAEIPDAFFAACSLRPAAVRHLENTPSLNLDLPLDAMGLCRLQRPFRTFSVNLWLYDYHGTLLAIDSGSEPLFLSQYLAEKGQHLSTLLTTHEHPDHIGGRKALFQQNPSLSTQAPATVRVIQTAGHCAEHLSYYFPDTGICFCGDALFASSMGSPQHSYPESLQSLKTLLSLPPETILCPGHGPATTVQRERDWNCFYRGDQT